MGLSISHVFLIIDMSPLLSLHILAFLVLGRTHEHRYNGCAVSLPSHRVLYHHHYYSFLPLLNGRV